MTADSLICFETQNLFFKENFVKINLYIRVYMMSDDSYIIYELAVMLKKNTET